MMDPEAKIDRTEIGQENKPFGGAILFSGSPPQPGKHRSDQAERSGAIRLLSALQSSGLAVLSVRLTMDKANKRSAAAGPYEKAVKSAVRRLSSRCGGGRARIAVIAEGDTADSAVLGAQSASPVRSFVLLSGRLSRRAKEILAAWEANPALCLVSSEDKRALRDMTDIYFASRHSDTDIEVFEALGRGMDMLDNWSAKFGESKPLERRVAEWIHDQLAAVGAAREVSFITEDGWKIFGNLLLPHSAGERAPGVVLLHSGRSDRYVFTDLERMLGRAGFAVLNIDWRGRGKSTNKGKYFELSKEERANGKLDARAAINFLANQPQIDPGRIGLIGIVHGAEHAVRGSIDDSRVKALVLLTGYVPISAAEREYLTSGKVHVMYVSCTGHKQVTRMMRDLYEVTPGKLSRFVLYEGGAIGYQLFETDEKLQPAIVEWLKEAL